MFLGRSIAVPHKESYCLDGFLPLSFMIQDSRVIFFQVWRLHWVGETAGNGLGKYK